MRRDNGLVVDVVPDGCTIEARLSTASIDDRAVWSGVNMTYVGLLIYAKAPTDRLRAKCAVCLGSEYESVCVCVCAVRSNTVAELEGTLGDDVLMCYEIC